MEETDFAMIELKLSIQSRSTYIHYFKKTTFGTKMRFSSLPLFSGWPALQLLHLNQGPTAATTP
jgi:hypothetical protein